MNLIYKAWRQFREGEKFGQKSYLDIQCFFTIQRRDLLCGGSVGLAAAIADCTGALGGGDGGPEYEEGDKEWMGLTVDAFPDGWQRDDSFNENFDRVFVNGDETIIVLTHIELFESVSDAEESFDQSRSGFRDP